MRHLFMSDILSELLQDSFSYSQPKTDYIVETDESFEIEIDMPGVSKDSIDISIEDDYLTITGSRKATTGVKPSQGKEYTKSYKLGTVVDQSNIKAKYEDGVLKVSVGKKPKPKATKVTIE